MDDPIDPRLRGALVALVPPEDLALDALDRIEAEVRSDAARRRVQGRRRAATGAIVAVAAAVVIALIAWPGSSHEKVSTGVASTTTATAHRPAFAADGHLLTLESDGSIVERSTVTGQIEAVVVDGAGLGIVSFAASADGSTVFLLAQPGPAANRTMNSYSVLRVAVGGGAAVPVPGTSGTGMTPLASSPDGRRLATTAANGVKVVDVVDGTSTTWALPSVNAPVAPELGVPGDDGSVVSSLSWSSDGRMVALSVYTLAGYQGVEILDTTREDGPDNPRLVGPLAETGSTPIGWTASAFRGTGGDLVALASCLARRCVAPSQLVMIDAASGRSSPIRETGKLQSIASPIASDGTGRTLFLLDLDTNHCTICQGGSGWAIDRVQGSTSTTLMAGPRLGGSTPAVSQVAWIP
jgi:hypothetical protein